MDQQYFYGKTGQKGYFVVLVWFFSFYTHIEKYQEIICIFVYLQNLLMTPWVSQGTVAKAQPQQRPLWCSSYSVRPGFTAV